MITSTVQSRGARAGSTLVVVVLLMAAVALLSLSFLTVLQASQKENQGSLETLSALYVCEAGVTAAVGDLASGGSGDLGSQQNPVEMGDQDYWVVSTPLGQARTSLVSYGRDDRAKMGVEVVVQPSADGYFRWAAFGDELMYMSSNARTDSYDSSVGSYASQQVNGAGSNAYANKNGDVGSNASITMNSNIGVWGDAKPGPAGTVSDTNPSGTISGSTTPSPAVIQLPQIIVPNLTSLGPKTVAVAETLGSGNYRYTNLQVNTNKVLTIIGPATVVVDNLKLKSGSQLVINSTNGPVEFFVNDDFVLNSNTTVSSTNNSPENITFNLLSDNILDPDIDIVFDEDLIDFDSGSKMYGTIYAPSAEIMIDSNFELFGALTARRTRMVSNCRIHYDEMLAISSEEAQSNFITLCWRLLPQP